MTTRSEKAIEVGTILYDGPQTVVEIVERGRSLPLSRSTAERLLRQGEDAGVFARGWTRPTKWSLTDLGRKQFDEDA